MRTLIAAPPYSGKTTWSRLGPWKNVEGDPEWLEWKRAAKSRGPTDVDPSARDSALLRALARLIDAGEPIVMTGSYVVHVKFALQRGLRVVIVNPRRPALERNIRAAGKPDVTRLSYLAVAMRQVGQLISRYHRSQQVRIVDDVETALQFAVAGAFPGAHLSDFVRPAHVLQCNKLVGDPLRVKEGWAPTVGNPSGRDKRGGRP